MRLHRPSLAAVARDAFQALGILAAVAAVTDWRTENRRLRERNRQLEFDNLRLSRILLAGASCEVAPSSEDLMALADAVAAHPAGKGQPISDGEIADGMAILDSDDMTAGDLLWLWGEVK